MHAADHYRSLGVPTSATRAEIRSAYLELARRYHPDRLSGAEQADAEARMRAVNEAWNVLGDARRRTAYDAARGDSASGGAEQPRRGHAHFRPFDDVSDLDPDPDVDLDPTPIAGSRPVPRWLNLAPIGLGLVACALFGLGMIVDARSVIALAVVVGALAAIGFLLVPLLIMSRAEKDPYL